MGRIISITSGKGGVGKTMSTINMALAAARSGSKILIVDGDLGLSNVDVVMGLETNGTLQDVLDGHATISDIVSRTNLGIDVISSGTGISKLANMSHLSRSVLVHELSKLPDSYDFVFIDTGAGISESVLTLNLVSDLFVVVTTPEPHAMTDAYALIKVMAEEHDRHDCALIVNQTATIDEGKRVGARIADVARRFCGSNVIYAGAVVSDTALLRSILARNVGRTGALASLCGQGWTQSWYEVLQLLNSGRFSQRSSGLSNIWEAIATPSLDRQNLDP